MTGPQPRSPRPRPDSVLRRREQSEADVRAIVQRIGGAGTPGPAGPAGPAGADGADGADGVDALGWSYARLSSDFNTSSTTASNVGLAFTPAANKVYEFQCYLLLRSVATTTGPRPGIAWATSGFADGAVRVFVPSAANAMVQNHDGLRNGVAANTGVGATTVTYLGTVEGMLVAGASPTGSVNITLASEVAASQVTARAGSFLRWRELPP